MPDREYIAGRSGKMCEMWSVCVCLGLIVFSVEVISNEECALVTA